MPKVVPEYKEKAKERILVAALRVFSQKGYHDARMEDIADELGVSKRTLYLYYKNKEDLFRAICEGAPKAMAEMLKACFQCDPTGMACATFFDQAQQGPPSGFEYEIIAAASRNQTLKKLQGELQENEIRVIAQILEDRKKKGVLPPSLDAHQMAMILIALFRGLNGDLIMGRKKAEVREAWIEATERLLAAPARR